MQPRYFIRYDNLLMSVKFNIIKRNKKEIEVESKMWVVTKKRREFPYWHTNDQNTDFISSSWPSLTL